MEDQLKHRVPGTYTIFGIHFFNSSAYLCISFQCCVFYYRRCSSREEFSAIMMETQLNDFSLKQKSLTPHHGLRLHCNAVVIVGIICHRLPRTRLRCRSAIFDEVSEERQVNLHERSFGLHRNLSLLYGSIGFIQRLCKIVIAIAHNIV